MRYANIRHDMEHSNPFVELAIPYVESAIGFEKEFSLRAKAKSDGTLYNLNLSVQLLAEVGTTLSPFSLVEEYSRCLLEVVSSPVSIEKAFETLDSLNKTQLQLNVALNSLVKTKYPDLLQQYEVSVEDDGCSPTNLYLNPDLSIRNDQTNPEQLVLPAYIESVLEKNSLMWSPVPGLYERMIGIYNGIQSFHFTYNPRYDGTNDYITYLSALARCAKLVEHFSPTDTGNKLLMRSNTVLELPTLARSIFLRELLSANHTVAQGIFIQSELFSNPDMYLERITKALTTTVGNFPLDTVFKQWPSFDMRPRIIDGTLPVMEVRRFGSSFSKTEEMKELLGFLFEPDETAHPLHTPPC